MNRPGLIQYKSVTAPTFTPLPVTVDSWHPTANLPPKILERTSFFRHYTSPVDPIPPPVFVPMPARVQATRISRSRVLVQSGSSIATPPRIAHGSATTANLMRYQRVRQYQRQAFVPVVTVAEITVDSWFTITSAPPKDVARTGHLAAGGSGVITTTFGETVNLEWHQQSVNIGRTAPSHHDTLPAPLRVEESVTLDKWYRELAGPLRSTLAPQPPSGGLLNPRDFPLTDKWFRPTEQPLRRAGLTHLLTAPHFRDVRDFPLTDKWYPGTVQIDNRLAGRQYQSLFWDNRYPPDFALVSHWHPAIQQPRLDLPRQQFGYPSSFWNSLQISAEIVTLDKWFRQTERPIWDIARRQYGHPFTTIDPRQLTLAERTQVDKWLRELSVPIQPGDSGAARLSAVALPAVESVLPKGWHSVTSQPSLSLARPVEQPAAIGGALPVVQTGWLSDAVRPAPVISSVYAYPSVTWQSTSEETQLDKWYQDLARPVLVKPVPSESLIVLPVFFVPPVEIAYWWEPLSLPVSLFLRSVATQPPSWTGEIARVVILPTRVGTRLFGSQDRPGLLGSQEKPGLIGKQQLPGLIGEHEG